MGNYDHNSKSKVSYNLDRCTEINVIPYKKNISIKRILSNVNFALVVNRLLKIRKFDIAYVVCPPNVTGYLNWRTIKKKKSLLIIDVFDLYPETIPIDNKFVSILAYPFFKIWSHLRDYTIKRCDIFIGSCNYYFTILNLKEDNNHIASTSM